MLAQADLAFLQHDDHHWNRDTPIPTFALIWSSSSADACRKRIEFYADVKHLLTRLRGGGVDALANYMDDFASNGHLSPATLRETLQQYRNKVIKGLDELRKDSL
jgi:hypothetical protein